jgi:translation initiation factor IF-3
MDYGKYLYEQEKREREAKKHQKTITVKEVKFSINVDEHDYETKRNHVIRFLEEGNKVKASLRFRGREMTRQSLGRGVLERLIKDLGDRAIIESYPRTEGNTMNLMLAPSKKAEKPEKGGKGDGGAHSQSNAPRTQAQPAQQQAPAAATVRQA